MPPSSGFLDFFRRVRRPFASQTCTTMCLSREGRKEGRKKGIGVNVLIGKRKEDVEVEEVKEGRGAAEDYCRLRLRVERGRCARRGVHSFDAWMSRAIASTRPPSTVRVARRRADAVARQYSSILATFQFRTIHFSLFTKSAMARRVIITSAPAFHYCPRHVSVLYPPFNSALSTT